MSLLLTILIIEYKEEYVVNVLINKNNINVFIGIYNNSISVSRSQCKVIKIN